jgi:hypothetical protein
VSLTCFFVFLQPRVCEDDHYSAHLSYPSLNVRIEKIERLTTIPLSKRLDEIALRQMTYNRGHREIRKPLPSLIFPLVRKVIIFYKLGLSVSRLKLTSRENLRDGFGDGRLLGDAKDFHSLVRVRRTTTRGGRVS